MHPPSAPRPGLAPTARSQGPSRAPPGLILLFSPWLVPIARAPRGDPGHARGRAARAATVRGRPCFALFFLDGLLGRPGEREDGHSRLGSASPLSISPLGCLRPPGSPAPVGAPRALGVAPNGGGTVLPGPPTWPSSLSAACSPALSTRRELPLSQRPPHLDSQVPESAGLCAGQDAVRGAVRTSRPGKGQHRHPARRSSLPVPAGLRFHICKTLRLDQSVHSGPF